jgi:hypothetical protein
MADTAKRLPVQKSEELDIYQVDTLKILAVKVTGLAYVPHKDDLNAYWPCTVTYSCDPDIDEHMIGLDDSIKPPLTAQAELYICECTKELIIPGVYTRIKSELRNGLPIFER